MVSKKNEEGVGLIPDSSVVGRCGKCALTLFCWGFGGNSRMVDMILINITSRFVQLSVAVAEWVLVYCKEGNS